MWAGIRPIAQEIDSFVRSQMGATAILHTEGRRGSRPRTCIDIGLATSRYAALTRPTLTPGISRNLTHRVLACRDASVSLAYLRAPPDVRAAQPDAPLHHQIPSRLRTSSADTGAACAGNFRTTEVAVPFSATASTSTWSTSALPSRMVRRKK